MNLNQNNKFRIEIKNSKTTDNLTVAFNNRLQKDSVDESLEKSSWLESTDLRQTILVLRAVNHRIRKSIIYLLEARKKMYLTAISGELGIEASVASQHIGILVKAGIVHAEKEGKFKYYSLNKQKLWELNGLIKVVNNCN